MSKLVEPQRRLNLPPYEATVAQTDRSTTFFFETEQTPDTTTIDLVQEGFINAATILKRETGYSTSGHKEIYDIDWQSNRCYRLFGYPTQDGVKEVFGVKSEQEIVMKSVSVDIPMEDSVNAEDTRKATVLVHYLLDGKPMTTEVLLVRGDISSLDEVGGIATVIHGSPMQEEAERIINGGGQLFCWDVKISTKYDNIIDDPSMSFLQKAIARIKLVR